MQVHDLPEAKKEGLRKRMAKHTKKTRSCWVWQAGKWGKGYGATSFYAEGRTHKVAAHRAAWQLHNDKPIPRGLLVMHKCDNKPCVRPSHLKLGTQFENLRDMVQKGRSATGDRHKSRTHPESVARGERHGSRTKPECVPRGESHSAATLNDDDVRVLRKRRDEGATFKELSKEFGVSPSSCHRLVHNTVRKVTDA